MNQKDFFNVDWTKIPEPKLDVNLFHLNNFKISDIELNSTDNKIVNIAKLKEITVIYIYPSACTYQNRFSPIRNITPSMNTPPRGVQAMA